MARVFTTIITADGDTTVPLHNARGKDRHIYTVYLSGDFGTGTVTAFLNADATNDIPIKDAVGAAISVTDDDMFNFEANSGSGTNNGDKVDLVITTASSTAASINLNVYDNT